MARREPSTVRGERDVSRTVHAAGTSPGAEGRLDTALVSLSRAEGYGLPLVEAILEEGELVEYHLAHSARGELYRRLGRPAGSQADQDLVAGRAALILTALIPAKTGIRFRILL